MLVYNEDTLCLQIVGSPEMNADLRHGANLPHLTKPGGVYSVTFRLIDSLPRKITHKWLRERENIVGVARQMERPLTDDECKKLEWLFREKIDGYLNNGRGACWLAKPEIAEMVSRSICHFDKQRYDLICWALMPNHAHIILHPRPKWSLSSILHSWKSYTSTCANKALQRSGEFWFGESYDHLIRDSEDLWHSAKYVLANPRKAGLANWRWTGTKVQPDMTGVKVLPEAMEEFRIVNQLRFEGPRPG